MSGAPSSGAHKSARARRGTLASTIPRPEQGGQEAVQGGRRPAWDRVRRRDRGDFQRGEDTDREGRLVTRWASRSRPRGVASSGASASVRVLAEVCGELDTASVAHSEVNFLYSESTRPHRDRWQELVVVESASERLWFCSPSMISEAPKVKATRGASLGVRPPIGIKKKKPFNFCDPCTLHS